MWVIWKSEAVKRNLTFEIKKNRPLRVRVKLGWATPTGTQQLRVFLQHPGFHFPEENWLERVVARPFPLTLARAENPSYEPGRPEAARAKLGESWLGRSR